MTILFLLIRGLNPADIFFFMLVIDAFYQFYSDNNMAEIFTFSPRIIITMSFTSLKFQFYHVTFTNFRNFSISALCLFLQLKMTEKSLERQKQPQFK